MPDLSYQLQTIVELLSVDSLADYHKLFAAFLKLAPEDFNLEDALAYAGADHLLEPTRTQQIFTDFVAVTNPGEDEAPVALLREAGIDLTDPDDFKASVFCLDRLLPHYEEIYGLTYLITQEQVPVGTVITDPNVVVHDGYQELTRYEYRLTCQHNGTGYLVLACEQGDDDA